MKTPEQQLDSEKVDQQNTEPDKNKKKLKKPKKEKFNWWQSLLILLFTLAVSVSASYFISDKYLWSHLDQNRLNEQLRHAKAQVDVKPNDPKLRVELGYAYFIKGKNDDAIKQYKIALDLDKKYYDAYLNLGITYNDEERYDDALKMAQKSTDLSPRDYKGHLLKGMVYRHLKMYDDAIKALNEANKLMPGNTDTITEVAKVAEDQGDKKQAEEIYKEALSYDPMYKPALEGLERVASNDANDK